MQELLVITEFLYFPSALQLRMSFGFLKNLPPFFTFPSSEAHYLVFTA
jgi:hypothetical protein